MVKIIWRKLALNQLNKVHKHIAKDSIKSANKVMDDIFDKAENLKLNPEIYPLDKYRIKNDGSFRSFEKYRYRISYQVTETEIRILRVRHTSREPLDY